MIGFTFIRHGFGYDLAQIGRQPTKMGVIMTAMRSDIDPLGRPDYEPRGVVYAGAMPFIRRISGEFSFLIAATAVYGAIMAGCALTTIA